MMLKVILEDYEITEDELLTKLGFDTKVYKLQKTNDQLIRIKYSKKGELLNTFSFTVIKKVKK